MYAGNTLNAVCDMYGAVLRSFCQVVLHSAGVLETAVTLYVCYWKFSEIETEY